MGMISDSDLNFRINFKLRNTP